MPGGALIVGYGSIGARHERLLRLLDQETALVTAQTTSGSPAYDDLGKALAAEAPSYVVIANDTARHHDSLAELAAGGYTGTVLIEKPLFDRVRALPGHGFAACYVGYNLRFHPVIQALARHLADEPVISVQAYVGQHLPDWHPDRDYRASSSASKARGGGALRDLSHELDLLTWLFGPWRRLAAVGGRYGSLEIDSDDSWSLLVELDRCPAATLQLNYLDRVGRRRLLVNTAAHSYEADLVAGTLTRDTDVERFENGRDATYLAEHRAALAGDGTTLCSLEEGLAVVAMIEAVERAARDGRWVAA